MPTTPQHFQVSSVGVPEAPGTHYVVLDVAHDPLARETLALLSAKYERRGLSQLAGEIRAALRSSNGTFLEYVERQQPKKKGKGKTSMKGVNP